MAKSHIREPPSIYGKVICGLDDLLIGIGVLERDCTSMAAWCFGDL